MDNRAAELFCRDALRAARSAVYRDSEAFGEILFAVERLGALLKGKVGGLSDYAAPLAEIARRSPLADSIPAMRSDLHIPFDRLFAMVQGARNDALHQGAYARHLAAHAIELSLVLEDALIDSSTKIGDYMVKAPVCAYAWQPLSFVRQQMLENALSFLPLRASDGRWRLVSDCAVAAVLRGAESKTQRGIRLASSISDAEERYGIILDLAVTATPDDSVNDVLDGARHQPILVTTEVGDLIGIVTAFDLL